MCASPTWLGPTTCRCDRRKGARNGSWISKACRAESHRRPATSARHRGARSVADPPAAAGGQRAAREHAAAGRHGRLPHARRHRWCRRRQPAGGRRCRGAKGPVPWRIWSHGNPPCSSPRGNTSGDRKRPIAARSLSAWRRGNGRRRACCRCCQPAGRRGNAVNDPPDRRSRWRIAARGRRGWIQLQRRADVVRIGAALVPPVIAGDRAPNGFPRNGQICGPAASAD